MHNVRDRGQRGEIVLFVCGVSLVVSAICALVWSREWPLVGDAALMHYVILLLQHGRAPYTQIVDINLPGSYLLEGAAIKVFGAGAAGLRLYDACLGLLLCGCTTTLMTPGWRARAVGAGAGLLFVLVHLQDGLAQAGQRDFAMAAIALCAYVCLFAFTRLPWGSRVLLYETLIGLTAIIKPTLLPLALIPLFVRPATRGGWWGFAGLAVPPLGTLMWLWRAGAERSFLDRMRSIAALHGSMGRHSVAYLLSHCTSPVPLLFGLLAALLIVLRVRPSPRQWTLFAGMATGLISYLAQGKGYPYQRYPLLAFFLLLLATYVEAALRRGGAARWVATLTIASACLWFSPRFALSVRTYDTTAPFEEALAADLIARSAEVAGGVQCLDTFGGCVNTLLNLHILQSTGFLYDCYLFAGPDPVRASYRTEFLRSFDEARPRVVVLTDQFCFGRNEGFAKVKQWPEFEARLSSEYTMTKEWHPAGMQHWWSRAELPASYRILLRREP